MDKTRTIGQKWLANELDTKKVYQRPIQSLNSFESYRANKLLIAINLQTQTDTHSRKPFFRV